MTTTPCERKKSPSEVDFGSKRHIQNLLNLIENSWEISRKYDGTKLDVAQRALGMIEAVLCIYMPDKFAPGRRFEYENITITRKTLFGKIKTQTRTETYVEMLLRNLRNYYNTLN